MCRLHSNILLQQYISWNMLGIKSFLVLIIATEEEMSGHPQVVSNNSRFQVRATERFQGPWGRREIGGHLRAEEQSLTDAFTL